MVALTLPEAVLQRLREIHSDVGWAIVMLVEQTSARALRPTDPERDAELVTAGDRRSLIVVNRAVFKSLPGINIIPLHGNKAFLALDVGRGMTDLELAVIDRLDAASVEPRERNALTGLRSQLRIWRHDPALRFHSRAIIVVEQQRAGRARPK